MPSVSSIDAENGHNQFEMRYEVVGKQNRDSFDSLLLRPESPDRNKEVPSSAVDPQTPGTLRPSSTWQRGRRLWSYGWVAETVGFSVALISLMSILIVLLSYQNRQVDTWPLFITINAFIAVFTVLLKAGLALPLSEGISQLKWQWFQQSPRRLMNIHDFDEASRGAWASLMFLFQVDMDGFERPSSLLLYLGSLITYLARQKEFSTTKLLARFGALLIVLAFAADPFTQQIVGNVDCPQISPNTRASVARTSSYMAQGGHVGANEADIDSPMAVAITTGLINPPANAATLVETDCASGNCTFPRFQTVGVCHACQDISAAIHNATGAPGSSPAPIRNFTLQDPASGDVTTWIGQGVLFSSAAPVALSTLSDVLELQVLTNADNWAGAPSAYACQMYPCVRTYDAAVAGSVRAEAVVNTTRIGQNQLYGRTDRRALFALATSHTFRNGTLAACERKPGNDTGLVEVALANVDAAPDDIASTSTDTDADSDSTVQTGWFDADCVWTFGWSSASVIKQQLAAELDDTHMQMTGGVTTGPLVAKTLWRNGTLSLSSIDGFMAGLTDTMTATMRNRGEGGAGEYAQGDVVVNETCVAVRWAWFSYPAVLVGLSALFLLLLVVHVPTTGGGGGNDGAQQGRGARGRLWKSSTLAMLFCGVDESIARNVRADSSGEEIKQVARDTRAQLVRDGDGRARFV